MSNNRIILSRADFSANNIGRYVELSDFTKKVLSKQTQFSEDSAEAIALDSFLNNLITDGFIGGETPLLDDMIIPGLASSHDELLYDIAHLDENGYPTNVMTSEEISAASNKKIYRPVINDGKIVALQRYTDDTIINTDANAQSRMTNYAFVNRNTNNQPYKPFSIIFYAHNSTTGNAVYFQSAGGSLVVRNFSSQYVVGSTRQFGVDYTSLGKFNIIGYDDTTVTMDATIDGITTSGTAGTAVNYGTGNPSKYEIGTYVYSFNAEVSFIAMGDNLTSEQRATLKGYVETLLTALHATF